MRFYPTELFSTSVVSGYYIFSEPMKEAARVVSEKQQIEEGKEQVV